MLGRIEVDTPDSRRVYLDPEWGREGHAEDHASRASAKKSELPSTLQRSGRKAQDTYAKTYDAAADQYDSEERAQRTAFASLKHTHEKVGDHWEPKDEKGPSDARAEERGGRSSKPTAGGVDANATKEHLMELARRLDVHGALADVQGRAGRGAAEGERPGQRQGPQGADRGDLPQRGPASARARAPVSWTVRPRTTVRVAGRGGRAR